MVYDADGRLVKSVDEEGSETNYTYDADGLLVSMTNAKGFATTFTYDEMHRVVTMTDARGGVTAYEYNERGEVTKVTDAEGYETSYTYDGNGNTTSMTTPDGTTTYEYDPLDRLTKTTGPDGNSESYEYDKLGNMTAVTDRNGNRTQYVLDGNGNVVETIDALGTSAKFTYDKVGNLVKADLHRVDSQDKVDEHEITLYSYDGRGLVTTIIDAENNQVSYKYDGNGNLIEQIDKDGLVTQYAYSPLDLVNNINYNGGKQVSYAYNKVGELVQMEDWQGTTTYEVDLLRQLTKVTDHKNRVVEYTYDEVGNESTIKYPDNTVVSYTYDLVQNMKTVTESNNGNVTSYDYDGMRRVIKQVYPNGWVTENEYDCMGNVVKIYDIDPSQKDLKTIKHTYTYDAYGNMLSEYKRGNGQGQAKEDWAYQYDALNRLVKSHEDHGNETRNYQYDSLGNLTYEWNSNNVKVDYKLNNLNQITTKTDDGWKTWTDYSYDKRGNITEKVYNKNKKHLVAGSYEYDETNRMVKGINDIGEQSIYHFNGLGILVTNEWLIKKNAYGYHDVTAAALEQVTAQDGMNSEIIADADSNKKKVKSKKPAEEVATKPELNKTSHVIKDFVIDYNSAAQENLMEYELYDEGLTYRYVYGTDKLGVTAYTIPNGSASVTTENGEIPLYYHMDHMGSSEFLTSDVTQRITSWTSYDEWGNITHNAVLKCGTRELDLVKNYTGHERDSVLGMYYAKARLYDTADKHGSTKGNKLGDKRFMAVDPVKGNVRNPQSMVQYTYVQNNPILYVDPLGRINYLNADQRNAFVQGIGSGIWQFAGDQWETIKNLPKLPGLIKDLTFDILDGNVDPVELLSAMVEDGFSDAEYLLSNAVMLLPETGEGKYSVEEINAYSIRLGNLLGEASGVIIGALTGSAAGNAVAKYLNSTGRLKGKLDVKGIKEYNKKLDCEDTTKKNWNAFKQSIDTKENVTVKMLEKTSKELLLDELEKSGKKYNAKELIAISKSASGDIVWLETGNTNAGFKHIVMAHGQDFARVGIAENEIPDLIISALERGEIIGYQGKGQGRPIYRVLYRGQVRNVAVTTGSNGFIVGANPSSAIK